MGFLTKVRKAAIKKILGCSRKKILKELCLLSMDFPTKIRNPVRKILKVTFGFSDQNQKARKHSKRAVFALQRSPDSSALADQSPVIKFTYQFNHYPRFLFNYPMNQHFMTLAP